MSDDDAHGPRPAPLSPEHKLIFAQGKRRLLENMFGMPGEVGRFELRRKLGEGGMGAVYLAWDPRLEREVALKLPSIEHPDLRRRFIREAKFMAKLDHPNTVAIYEAGELEGQAYIAMELIEGPTLEAWLAEGPRSSEAILERFLDAGRGLAEVHAQGLVHRDFKPGNVMIDPRGRARVMDFGLARSAEHDGSGDSPLTRTGMILGTLAYMSPEQVAGARVGPRSDQFSFCVALYEALYGARPYAHDGEGLPTFTELDAGALPGERPEGLSLGAERALVRGLQLDRAGRFEDMDALLVALTNAALRDEEPRADSLGRAETLDLVEASTLGLAGGREAAPSRTSASAEVAAGRMIDKYVVTRLLGKGGMGVVHVAYEPALDRKVALKLLERSRRHSNADLLRFAREARGLARVRHPNVVEIYNFGPCDDGMFIAMEYVEGATLADWREQSGADWRAILEVMVGAGRGLAAAHEHGLVHRDFKPSNAIVGEDGRVRVLDFGLVRPIDGDEDELTAKHAVIGTYRYMALEQIEGQAVGPAADQFSFCVVAFELLYGESPFAGRNVAQRGLNMRAGAIAARPRDSPVPRRVHAALVRGLAAAPGRRWPSMEALLAELGACLEVQRRRRWLGLGLGGGVATLGLGLLAAWVIGLLWARLHEREAELAVANEALGQRNVELEQRNVELARSVDIELARTLAATARAPRQRVDALTGAVELYACYALGLSGCASTPGQGVPWQVEAAMFATTRGLRRAWERGGHEASITPSRRPPSVSASQRATPRAARSSGTAARAR